MRYSLLFTAIALFVAQRYVAQPSVGAVTAIAPQRVPASEDPITYARRAVVTLRPGRGIGSGVVVSPDGDIISNHHVVEPACRSAPCSAQVEVRFNSGITSTGTVIATDEKHDLSLIRVKEKDLPFLRFDSAILKGEEVIAIGSPCGKPDIKTSGKVLGLPGESIRGLKPPGWHFFHDAVIKPGNSGGATIKLSEGVPKLVGVNVGIPKGESKGDECADPPPGRTSIAIAASVVEQFYRENR